MTDHRVSVASGDSCPHCRLGIVEIYSSPTPEDGKRFRTRYLRCSRKGEGCGFRAKQVVPESLILHRIS